MEGLQHIINSTPYPQRDNVIILRIRQTHTHIQLIIQILSTAKTGHAVREKGKALGWIFLGKGAVKKYSR